MQTEDFLREFEKTRNKMGRQFIQKKQFNSSKWISNIKEILQLLESQSSVQIIVNENNTNAIYYKIEFKVYYRINFY
jgi:flagellar biosynthesis/type III secretory pathway protein FliH